MKPTARIEIDGKDRTTEWSKIIESITVHDEAGVYADTLELAFDNAKPIVAPPIGAEIRV